MTDPIEDLLAFLFVCGDLDEDSENSEEGGDDMSIVECSRCGAIMERPEWEGHRCKGMRDLSEMPLDILERVANKEITEEEGWEETDRRNK